MPTFRDALFRPASMPRLLYVGPISHVVERCVAARNAVKVSVRRYRYGYTVSR